MLQLIEGVGCAGPGGVVVIVTVDRVVGLGGDDEDKKVDEDEDEEEVD